MLFNCDVNESWKSADLYNYQETIKKISLMSREDVCVQCTHNISIKDQEFSR